MQWQGRWGSLSLTPTYSPGEKVKNCGLLPQQGRCIQFTMDQSAVGLWGRQSNRGQRQNARPDPRPLRDELHWEAGTQLALISTPSGVTIRAMPQKAGRRLEDLIGMLKHEGPPISTDDLCKPVDDRAEWEASEKHDG